MVDCIGAENAGGESLQHAIICTRGIVEFALGALGFSLIEAGPFGDERRVVLVIGDLLEQLLGLGVVLILIYFLGFNELVVGEFRSCRAHDLARLQHQRIAAGCSRSCSFGREHMTDIGEDAGLVAGTPDGSGECAEDRDQPEPAVTRGTRSSHGSLSGID